ncbi:MAG: hypothetical protein AAF762_04815 [Pseudomonadota bacterium]
MAWTPDDVNKLKRAMASGARKVRFKDHETEFRSLNEMRRQLDDMEREVAGRAPVRRTVAVFASGR